MKASQPKKLPDPAQTPVFPKVIHHRLPPAEKTALDTQAKQRENTFSKSRDTREDRGVRQAKTSQNSSTLARGK